MDERWSAACTGCPGTEGQRVSGASSRQVRAGPSRRRGPNGTSSGPPSETQNGRLESAASHLQTAAGGTNRGPSSELRSSPPKRHGQSPLPPRSPAGSRTAHQRRETSRHRARAHYGLLQPSRTRQLHGFWLRSSSHIAHVSRRAPGCLSPAPARQASITAACSLRSHPHGRILTNARGLLRAGAGAGAAAGKPPKQSSEPQPMTETSVLEAQRHGQHTQLDRVERWAMMGAAPLNHLPGRSLVAGLLRRGAQRLLAASVKSTT